MIRYSGRPVDPAHARKVWDRLAAGDFVPAVLRAVDVDGYPFKVLLSSKETFVPDVYLENKASSLLVWPRLQTYPHRFILTPRENLTPAARWDLRKLDLDDMLAWAVHMQHVVTFSTFKAGASHPAWLHAQSFPVEATLGGDRWTLTALAAARTQRCVAMGAMPHFKRIAIGVLDGYPAPGVVLTDDGTEEGRHELRSKVYELTVNWDASKSFDLVILPPLAEYGLRAFFFPRRRWGRAIYGDERWQIAALELNGLMQCRSADRMAQMNADEIRRIFAATTPEPAEFAEFLEMLNTF